MKTGWLAAIVLAVLAGLALPGPVPASERPTIYETLGRMKTHAILFVAAGEGEAAGLLKGEKPYTLFAPTDDAFKALGDEALRKLATDPDAVRQFVRAHLAAGAILTPELKTRVGGMDVVTVRGNGLKVRADGETFRVGGAKITTADIRCSNGVIHVIDAVLPVTK